MKRSFAPLEHVAQFREVLDYALSRLAIGLRPKVITRTSSSSTAGWRRPGIYWLKLLMYLSSFH